jgi:MFS family permease
MLAALVDTLSQNDALARQRSAVVSVRRSQAAVQLLAGLGALLGGACLLAFGIVAFQQGWRVHGRLLAIILGGVLALVGLFAVPFLLFELFWNSRKVVFAGTPADAFRKTCEKALREFKEDPRAWSEVAEFLAFPRFDRYAGSLDSGRALSLRWRDLRESLVADAAQIEFGPVETTPRPGFGERVVNVRMEVRVPGRSLWLHNTAVAVGDHWFLTDGEPMTGGAT